MIWSFFPFCLWVFTYIHNLPIFSLGCFVPYFQSFSLMKPSSRTNPNMGLINQHLAVYSSMLLPKLLVTTFLMQKQNIYREPVLQSAGWIEYFQLFLIYVNKAAINHFPPSFRWNILLAENVISLFLIWKKGGKPYKPKHEKKIHQARLQGCNPSWVSTFSMLSQHFIVLISLSSKDNSLFPFLR